MSVLGIKPGSCEEQPGLSSPKQQYLQTGTIKGNNHQNSIITTSKEEGPSSTWRHAPVILALERLRLEDQEFKASLGNTANLMTSKCVSHLLNLTPAVLRNFSTYIHSRSYQLHNPRVSRPTTTQSALSGTLPVFKKKKKTTQFLASLLIALATYWGGT